MLIRLLNVMHKMRKVLAFKSERLLRCFFSWKSLVLILGMIGLFGSLTVQADSDGSLKIKSDMLTQNPIQLGGVGDFPIRGKLFSSEVSRLLDQKGFKHNEWINQAKGIDFSTTVKAISDGKQVKQLLFDTYQPRVITTNTQENNKQSNELLLLCFFGLLLLSVFGALFGRGYGIHKLKKQRRSRLKHD